MSDAVTAEHPIVLVMYSSTITDVATVDSITVITVTVTVMPTILVVLVRLDVLVLVTLLTARRMNLLMISPLPFLLLSC